LTAHQRIYPCNNSPLWDPLELNKETRTNYKMMTHLCEHADGPLEWKNQKLLEIMQERQEEWFANWVSQMVRIAKPGAPVIIEELAPPYCQAKRDWGGVTKDFWKQGVERYGWDIDPSSIAFHDRKKRYHVFMKKN
jgi:hypothetical protein